MEPQEPPNDRKKRRRRKFTDRPSKQDESRHHQRRKHFVEVQKNEHQTFKPAAEGYVKRNGGPRKQYWLTVEEYAWLKQMRAAKSCSEKIDFETETAAMKSAIERMARIDRPAPPLRAYQCNVCSKWHLTSKPAHS